MSFLVLPTTKSVIDKEMLKHLSKEMRNVDSKSRPILIPRCFHCLLGFLCNVGQKYPPLSPRPSEVRLRWEMGCFVKLLVLQTRILCSQATWDRSGSMARSPSWRPDGLHCSLSLPLLTSPIPAAYPLS